LFDKVREQGNVSWDPGDLEEAREDGMVADFYWTKVQNYRKWKLSFGLTPGGGAIGFGSGWYKSDPSDIAAELFCPQNECVTVTAEGAPTIEASYKPSQLSLPVPAEGSTVPEFTAARTSLELTFGIVHGGEALARRASMASRILRGSMWASERTAASAAMRGARGLPKALSRMEAKSLGVFGAALSGFLEYEESAESGQYSNGEAVSRGVGAGAGSWLLAGAVVLGCGAFGVATAGIGGAACFLGAMGAGYFGGEYGADLGGGAYDFLSGRK
jgi:hypothetical protein